MPNYDYHCDDCGLDAMRFVPIADRNDQRCERCELPLRLLISPVAIHGTTTRLMSGSDDGFGNDNVARQIAYAKARAAGVSVSGKKWHPGLCPKGESFSPKAWYRDEAEVKHKAEALGRNVEGSITHQTPIRDKDIQDNEKPYRIAPDLVQGDVLREVVENHGGKATPRLCKTLTEKYRDKHSGSSKPIGKVDLFR